MKLNHLAIIMDGNRRWARMRTLRALAGHDKGAERLQEAARNAAGYGIKYLSVFAFSAENWRRSDAEVTGLLSLMRKFLKNEIDSLVTDNVRLYIIGDRLAFDAELQGLFAQAEARTAACDGLHLTVAVNYGGQQDIEQAAHKMAAAAQAVNTNPASLHSCLMTSHLPPVDLLIRTGGEKRLSNFLLWELSYAELYFTDIFWPDFDAEALKEAVAGYYNRKRRFGGDDSEIQAGQHVPIAEKLG